MAVGKNKRVSKRGKGGRKKAYVEEKENEGRERMTTSERERDLDAAAAAAGAREKAPPS